ncbi:hypothetical protein GQ44DRAFT_693322, partial [Phaeosphaeriaceae sp. PMI808]
FIHKYRVSILFPFIFAVASFALTIVVVLGGQQDGSLEGHYLIAINTTRIGQNIIRLNRTNLPSTGRPSDTLNNFLNLFEPLFGNLTDATNQGVNAAVSNLTQSALKTAGINETYFVYLQKICSVSRDKKTNALIRTCEDWDALTN